MKLLSFVERVCSLSAADRDAMFRLMEDSYDNMRREQFEEDLKAKQWVILVRCPETGRLVGFSTQAILESCVRGQPVRALYSGDTVMDRRYWGDPALAHAWGNFALELIDEHTRVPLYWFLTSKGFRTYRYLPLFFHVYFPRAEEPTPAVEEELIDAFARRVADERYDSTNKIIRVNRGKDFLRPELAEPGMRLGTDPHVHFFVTQNPAFARGDELCCVAPLSRENFTRAAYRVINARTSAPNVVNT